ncbi:MAG: hypothetical protein ACK4PI_12395 [Tepidisphaerales bacterium]
MSAGRSRAGPRRSAGGCTRRRVARYNAGMTATESATAAGGLRALWGVGLLTMAAGVTVLAWLAQGGADGWNRVPLVVARLAIDGGVVALWTMAAAGAGSALLRIAGLWSACRGGAGVMAVSLGWGAFGLATLLLGLAGRVGSGVAWGLVAVGLAAGAWAVRGQAMRLATPAGRSWPGWVLGGGLAGTAVFLALFPAGVLWPTEPNGYDVLAYHLQLPREWFELGRIAVLSHNVFSYMPLGMEMHYLTAMGLLGDPWGAMYAAQLMHVAVWVAAGVAAYGLGTAVARVMRPAAGGGAETAPAWVSVAGWVSAGVVVGSPLAVMLAPIAYNEGAVVLYGVLALRAVVELLGGVTGGEASEPPTWGGRGAVLAGVFGGLAAGAKLTAVPLWLAALPLGVLCVVRPFSRGLRMGALVLAAGLAVSSPWWVRTAVSAGGNPVFPVAAGKLGAPAGWDATRVERFERAHLPREDQRSVSGRLQALWRQVVAAPEFGWVLLPGTVMLGVFAVGAAGAGGDARGGRAVAALGWGLLGVHAAVWLGLTHLQGRFWTAALPVMALLWAAGISAAVGPGRGRAVRRWLAASGAGVVMVSVGVAVGVVYVRLGPFRAADGRLVTEVVGVEFPVVERLMVAEETLSVPPNEMLTLVGDARAYAYRRPMASLKYTGVFDVAGATAAEGWRVGSDDWVLVHPGELSRLSRTYRGLPPVPSAWQTLPGPTLLPPGDPRRGR